MRAILVEVEAYLGLDDPASHAFRGPTRRAGIMFGPPGMLYVYLSYGLHHCANIVCEPAGRAGAVLLRAASVTAGVETVRARRLAAPRRREAAGWRLRPPGPLPGEAAPATAPRHLSREALLRGPGNLCRGMGLSLADNGLDLGALGGRLQMLPPDGSPPRIDITPRIGITAATDQPLRFVWHGHPALSRGAPPA